MKFYTIYILIFFLMFLDINGNPNRNNTKNQLMLDTLELPADFPPITFFAKKNPAPGVLMFPCSGKGYGNFIVYMDTNGKIINYKRTLTNASNFSEQPNGMIIFNLAKKSYFKAYSEARIYIADADLNVVDSIVSGNEFIPSPHTSMILPNGNYLYTSFEPHYVDMSKVVAKGNPNAVVAGAVLVEMDINKNVVFQWRSWDYIPISDTYQPINDFLNVTTLYSNFNSVDIDKDGNFIVSNRLLSEITKIDRQTGDIIWRMGGKHNEFTFLNERKEKEPFYFSLQHDIRLLPNGNITIFDNGDQHSLPVSRGIEYSIDQENKTATRLWDFEATPSILALSAGSTQKLSNGNYLISWGNNSSTLREM